MTRTRRRLVATVTTFVAVMVAPAIRAQTPPQAPAYIDAQRGLTIEDIVALALQQSHRVAAARARVEVARGERTQAGLRANPRATFEQAEQTGGSDRQTTVGVSWPLELFRRSARTDVAERRIDLAGVEGRSVEWQLASDVRRAAAQLLAAIRILDLTGQQAGEIRALRDLVGASADRGAVPRLDRDVAEVELRRMDAVVFQRQGDVDAALARLKGLAGVDATASLALKQSIGDETRAAVGVTGRLLDAAQPSLDQRPDLQKLSAQAAMSEAEQRQLRQDARWDLELMGGYMHTGMSFPQSGVSPGGALVPIANGFNYVTFGASIALPWVNKNQGARAAAASAQQAVLRERDALNVEAHAELLAATARWSGARRALAVYDDGLLELARKNVDVVQQTYQAGRGTLNDVIAERRRELDLEVSYAALLLDLYDADLDVRRALGVIR